MQGNPEPNKNHIPMIHHLLTKLFAKQQSNQKQLLREYSIKIKKEIELLYLIPQIEIPVEKQLKYAQEIVECYHNNKADPPAIAVKKAAFIQRMNTIICLILLGTILCVAVVIFYLNPKWNSFKEYIQTVLLALLLFCIVYASVAVCSIYVIKNYDRRISNANRKK